MVSKTIDFSMVLPLEWASPAMDWRLWADVCECPISERAILQRLPALLPVWVVVSEEAAPEAAVGCDGGGSGALETLAALARSLLAELTFKLPVFSVVFSLRIDTWLERGRRR